jgi:hypothetical protein
MLNFLESLAEFCRKLVELSVMLLIQIALCVKVCDPKNDVNMFLFIVLTQAAT